MEAILPRTLPAPPSSGTIADLDLLFRGFADPTRIRILNLLAAGELCVCDMVGILGLPQSTVSRHLGYLRRSELVEVERGAKLDHYRLATPSLQVHSTLLGCVRTCFRGIPQLDRERAAAEAKAKIRAAEPC
jgi:ArsR family transcriptional regulator, arsenate/arsenite/antimonite-responsive transcriptional repressor